MACVRSATAGWGLRQGDGHQWHNVRGGSCLITERTNKPAAEGFSRSSNQEQAHTAAIAHTERWFRKNGWTVFDFQRDTWQAWHRGESGLVHSPTGSGKTLAAWLGAVQSHWNDADSTPADDATDTAIRVLWITPLRALAGDTRAALQSSAESLGVPLRVDARTGDTSTGQRTRQRSDPPFALVTTPESLSVLLTQKDCQASLGQVHTVIVDEWHELMSSKRGVQLELCLARLRAFCSSLRVWGLSATLANLDTAMQALLGPDRPGVLIQGVVPRAVEVRTLLPRAEARFPWSGHLGLTLVDDVIQAIDSAQSTLLFTNTRSQAELWYQGLLNARPEWLEQMALHHGSIDRKLRERIEDQLRHGELLCVVCTSSLDLGVDFSPVDQVMQVGSPKGIARLMQRAGRSGHRPGAVSRILCVPTHAFELVEIAAARHALEAGRIEPRIPLRRALDVLSQHLVTIAMGGGFVDEDMLAEVRSTHAYHELTDQEWQWVIDFITRGGQALQGYPQYHKVVQVAGVYRVMNEEVSKRHRMSIGTISSSTTMHIAYLGGKRLGTTEESFVARLNPGDSFHFAGKHIELVMIKDMTAYVRKATRRSRIVPRWSGTQLPLSTELADSVLDALARWTSGQDCSPELAAIEAPLQLQANWSHLPGPDDFLVEYTETHDGFSLFCYPFAGRLANEGLAMLVAARLSRTSPMTFNLSANDYGFELQSETRLSVTEPALAPAFATEHLLDDILSSVNASEIAKRKFRDIARIAGLVFDGYPGRNRSARQVQASSGLIFEVLESHDADNLLLDQAHREVLESQLEYQRLYKVLTRLATQRWIVTHPQQLTPLAFPIWAQTIQGQTISTEPWHQRVERMLASLEAVAEDTLGEA